MARLSFSFDGIVNGTRNGGQRAPSIRPLIDKAVASGQTSAARLVKLARTSVLPLFGTSEITAARRHQPLLAVRHSFLNPSIAATTPRERTPPFVVEPPSKRLQQILFGMKLCSPRDVRRCASRVRRLSADLPAFDSVWLDALVQRRILTSWQAQTIESDQLELLRIGPSVALEQIGRGQNSSTFLTRLTDQHSRCVVKRAEIAAELRKPATDRLRKLIERSQGLLHAGLVVPHSFSEVTDQKLQLPPASSRSSLTKRSSSASTNDASSRGRNSPKPRRRITSQEQQAELAIVSRVAEGLTLAQMQLRRGRFPAGEVTAIARQLLDALVALHERRIIHGEISLSNVLLDRSGQTILVDAGIQPALQPEFHINAFVNPNRYEGIAPELIGTGEAANEKSDLYALGCLLWNLLAGRSPFPTGDPLAKLASHQTERIPDIREFAPDTPDRLAEAILWLTEPVASRRPQSASEVLTDGHREHHKTPAGTKPQTGRSASSVSPEGESKELTRPPAAIGHPGRNTRRRLSRFADSFQQPAQRASTPTSRRRMLVPLSAATAAVALAAATVLTLKPEAGQLIAASISQLRPVSDVIDSGRFSNATVDSPVNQTQAYLKPQTETEATASTAPASDQSPVEPGQLSEPVESHRPIVSPTMAGLMPLPEPDAFGVITLDDGTDYEAGRILWPGANLTLRGPQNRPARIVVTEQPLVLRSTEVTLENVAITRSDSATASQSELAVVRSQTLTCIGSSFESSPKTEVAAANHRSNQPIVSAKLAIQWAPIDPTDPLSGEITLQNCELTGTHTTIALGSAGRRIQVSNTLKQGPGPLFLTTPTASFGSNSIRLEHSTLRNSGSLIALDLRDDATWNEHLKIEPLECVFDLTHRTDGSAESLITFIAGRLQRSWHERVHISGKGSVAGRQVGLAAWQAADGQNHQTLDDSGVSVKGLIQTTFSFRSSSDSNRENSVISELHANRTSAQPPGILSTNHAIDDLSLDDASLTYEPAQPRHLQGPSE